MYMTWEWQEENAKFKTSRRLQCTKLEEQLKTWLIDIRRHGISLKMIIMKTINIDQQYIYELFKGLKLMIYICEHR